MKILRLVINIISAKDSHLLDDELFAAFFFFTNASEDTICAAHTFIALGDNQIMQHHFLIYQLEIAALLPGNGKGKTVKDDSMTY